MLATVSTASAPPVQQQQPPPPHLAPIVTDKQSSHIADPPRGGLRPIRRHRNRITVVRTTSTRNLNTISFRWTAIARPVDRVTRRHSSSPPLLRVHANKDCFVSFPGASLSDGSRWCVSSTASCRQYSSLANIIALCYCRRRPPTLPDGRGVVTEDCKCIKGK